MNSNDTTETALFTKEFTKDPFLTYAKLRKTDPIYRCLFPDGQYGWMITRYEDAVEALKDLRFVKDYYKLNEDEMAHRTAFDQSMLFSDPPDHKRLRGLVQKSFSVKMIEEMRTRIQEITDELLDEWSGKTSVDLINEFAFPLPIIVICEMLGVPTEDRDKFRIWSTSLIEGPDGDFADEIDQHMDEFFQYLSQRFEIVRRSPGEDLISQLIIAEEEGDKLTEQELYGVVMLLIVAGHETTVNLIGNTILALLEHPEQLQLLIQEPDRIHSAIEESLRYNGPVEFSTSRWVSEDIEFKGKAMKKGELIIIALNSADHDEEKFDNPEQFDITKEKSQHLAFGKGIHLCLGAPLARLEGEIAISSLVQCFPNIKLQMDMDELEWRPGMVVRGVKEIPLFL
ncbi:cytochrome P450 family protein [Paenibacillus pini]|uniref:Cytochrome P450 hydroxylase n=1 Tax=Paenibacillus pini JCM 16418 TaxID=1236976 RepID=W7YST2_9BACL|nr:cytochrome P450 [Paenibacillus pini]GAF07686.1 cytochrome P450 hydroxylase [Paenibacillus pini JCM 16418]